MLIRLHPSRAPRLALGTDLVLHRADLDDPKQLWQYDDAGRLTPAGRSLAVTAIPHGVDLDLAQVSRTDPAQRWLLRHNMFHHPATGLVLRPEHFVPVPGSRVLLGTPTSTDAAHWHPNSTQGRSSQRKTGGNYKSSWARSVVDPGILVGSFHTNH